MIFTLHHLINVQTEVKKKEGRGCFCVDQSSVKGTPEVKKKLPVKMHQCQV